MSIAVEPPITPAALFTTCWPTSKIAMTISKVWDTIHTATHILKKYLKNMKVSTSCMLLALVTMEINS